ncbi:TetR/AcrR family transcriptional regulator [Agromyces intestinalis]|uniref:TetR/AcrR family transcriptional regulator n=1 Tax=Agromyces intestinalis TaxID=2592652 RepID=A0A5C1YEF1_9MICO|nr:TetR/AcrR family transcriptional regulator [Agromyces intestinalis]QEO14424.1 TetR/AcrR family transcriptional regulator [Agromyces intestinalis]
MDPRIARTRRSLQGALLELAREHPLDEIAIADIAERAGVNRSSFYQHYPDKDTLLADALDAAVEEAGASLPELDGRLDAPPEALVSYLRHYDENADLYRRVLGAQGSGVARARLRARIEQMALEGIRMSGADAYQGLPLDVAAAGVTGSVLGVLEAWLERDPRPPLETAVDWVWRMLLGPAVP